MGMLRSRYCGEDAFEVALQVILIVVLLMLHALCKAGERHYFPVKAC